MYLDLSQVKKHILVDETFTDDDNYIQSLMDVAEASVSKHIDCSLACIEQEDGTLPPPVIHAMLLMVGNLYANREPVAVGVSVAELPLSYNYIVNLYRNYWWDFEQDFWMNTSPLESE